MSRPITVPSNIPEIYRDGFIAGAEYVRQHEPKEPRRFLRPWEVVKDPRGYPWGLQELAQMRCKGDGPKFRKIGNRIVYAREDLDAAVLKLPLQNRTESDK